MIPSFNTYLHFALHCWILIFHINFVLKINKMTTDPVKSILAFYVRQSIFLTAATGFFSKVFIEKILRSCPDVREIFLLVRPKKELK